MHAPLALTLLQPVLPPHLLRFPTCSIRAIVLKITSGQVDPIPAQYSRGLRRLVELMLSQDPKRRPDTASILRLPMMKPFVDWYIKQHPRHLRADSASRKGPGSTWCRPNTRRPRQHSSACRVDASSPVSRTSVPVSFSCSLTGTCACART